MTPKRKWALQWFHDRGEVQLFGMDAPSDAMRSAMVKDGQLESRSNGDFKFMSWFLTDKGRRDLHEG